MQKTHNTLDPKIRQQSIDTLNKLLATSIDLHAQVKQAHWNVRGTNFIAIHELFDKVAEEAGEWSDLIAERTNGLGGPARGTIQVANGATELEPYPLEIADWPEHVEAIAKSLATFGERLRAGIESTEEAGDPLTSDLLTEVARGVDQQLWFVEAHTQPVEARSPAARPKLAKHG